MIQSINRDQLSLSQAAKPATTADMGTVIDLLDTLKAHQDICVGMAANMISVNKAIIVVQIGPLPVAMINPEIIDKKGKYQVSEGCLSLTGERQTTRYQQIKVKFQDRNFKWQTQTFSGFIAETIQHEIDHTNGIII